MNTDWISDEEEAIRSLLALMESARRTRSLYERAGMSIPEPLRRFLGMSDEPSNRVARASVPAPSRRAPAEAKAGWLSVDVQIAGPAPLTLAVLRKAGERLRAKEVFAQVISL